MSEKTVRRPIQWQSESATDVGKVRKINEDALAGYDDKALWLVADGMGGYEAGDVASNMIINAVEKLPEFDSLADTVDALEDQLIDVNQAIQDYAHAMQDGRTLGSTVVALAIRGRTGACVWAGDSRLYCYRHGKLLQLSRDHSHVEELVQQGFIKAEDASKHPRANVITRAVGAHEELFLDVNVFNVQVGDAFLLCSDGLYNAVDQSQIADCLALPDQKNVVEQLIKTALVNGAKDNVSVVVVKGEV